MKQMKKYFIFVRYLSIINKSCQNKQIKTNRRTDIAILSDALPALHLYCNIPRKKIQDFGASFVTKMMKRII